MEENPYKAPRGRGKDEGNRPRRLSIVESSRLHKFLGITPGDIPPWLLSTYCDGGGALVMGSALSFVAGVVCVQITLGLERSFSFLSWPLPVIFFVFAGTSFWASCELHNPERLARARKKRRECIWCGAKDTQPHRDGCDGAPW